MQNQYSLRSPAVKRLMREAQELKEATETYYAHPLEDNLFEWHFTIRGPEDTEFEGGIYHGRIVLPPEYPMKPPSIILLTPNGRFEIFKKICLSISGHHPESWQPSWSIRTALLAIIGFMPTHGNGAIGSLDYTADERKVLARRSLEFKCNECGPVSTILKPVTEASKESNREAKQLAQQINFQAEKEKKGGENESKSSTVSGEAVPAEAGKDQSGQARTGPTPGQIPGFPIPPMGFPPFMQQAFRAPVTSATNVPPQFFMPPFWQGNNPQQRFGQQQAQQSINQRLMTNNPFWPPGFMMPPGMVPPPNVGTCKSQPVTTMISTTVSTAASGDQSPSSTSVSPTTTSESTSATSSSSAASASRSDEADRSETSSAASSSPSPAEETTVRQRQVVQTSVSRAQPQARVQRTNQPAELAVRQRSGGSGCIGFLMVVIGLVLALLIIRRLYVMKLLNFDFNF